MRMAVAVIRSRGRVVLPVEVRRALGVAEGDTVVFLLDGDDVRLARSPADFEEYRSFYGGAPDINPWSDEPGLPGGASFNLEPGDRAASSPGWPVPSQDEQDMRDDRD